MTGGGLIREHRRSDSSQTLEDTEGPLLTTHARPTTQVQRRSAFAQCLPQACAKACESPKTPSKASDASEWSATMACVGGTASAARLKRPKSSAQRGDGLRGRRHPQLGRAGEFAAQTNFLDAGGRMLVARPDFGRCPQHWRPPGAPRRSCSAAMEARLGWLRVCNVRTHALTKGLRPFFNQKRAPPKCPDHTRTGPLGPNTRS